MFNFPFSNSRLKRSEQDSRDEVYKSRTVSDVCPETTDVPEKEGERRGLIIGVSRFNSGKISPLDGVESDVELLRDRLLDRHCGFKSVDVLTKDSRVVPTLENILDTVVEFCKTCRPNDKSVVGLIGHGFNDSATNEDYFVPADAKPIVENDRVVSYEASSCFSFETLRTIYRQYPVAFNWTIVDACRVNMRTRDSSGGNSWKSIRKLNAVEGSFWSQSCSVGEESVERPFADGRTCGVFIWYLCEGLSGKADKERGLITPVDVQKYAYDKMTKDKTLRGQTPQSSGTNLSSASNFVIADFSDAKGVRAKKIVEEARRLLYSGNYDRAASTIDEAENLAPENEEVRRLKKLIVDGKTRERLAQGWRYYGERKYEEAFDAARDVLQIDTTNKDALDLRDKASRPPEEFAEVKGSKQKKSFELPNISTKFVEANIHAQVGGEAFDGKDYILALEEAETALKLDSSCEGAKKLAKKARAELDKLARLLQQGNDFFDAKRYENAIKKANEIKSLCATYPQADALEKKAKTSWFAAWIAEGEARLRRRDGTAAREAARYALQIIPNGTEALELEKKAIEAIADDLIERGEDDLERGDVEAAQDKVRQALQLAPGRPGAKSLEAKARQWKVNTAVAEGWKALGHNDKQTARRKVDEALKINPNDPGAKKLLEQIRKLSSVSPSAVWNGTRAGERREIEIQGKTYGLCWIPPGKFTMGSPKSEEGRCNDETQHEVELTKGFWMLETPVTQGLWTSVMGNNPSWFCSTGGGSSSVSGMDTTDFPVECVSWHDCQEFLKKLNKLLKTTFELPTEAQWEYACRAGTTTPYNFGSSLNGDKTNCDGNYPYGTNTKGSYLARTCAVKSYAANPWGLYDLHGNVWELCSDWYGAYPNGSVVDPIGPTNASNRVIRGGSWRYYAGDCRSAYRGCNDPAFRNSSVGFRLVSK